MFLPANVFSGKKRRRVLNMEMDGAAQELKSSSVNVTEQMTPGNNDDIENIISEISAAAPFESASAADVLGSQAEQMDAVVDATEASAITNGSDMMDIGQAFSVASQEENLLANANGGGDKIASGEPAGSVDMDLTSSQFSTEAPAGTSGIFSDDVGPSGDADDLGIELPLFSFRPASVIFCVSHLQRIFYHSI